MTGTQQRLQAKRVRNKNDGKICRFGHSRILASVCALVAKNAVGSTPLPADKPQRARFLPLVVKNAAKRARASAFVAARRTLPTAKMTSRSFGSANRRENLSPACARACFGCARAPTIVAAQCLPASGHEQRRRRSTTAGKKRRCRAVGKRPPPTQRSPATTATTTAAATAAAAAGGASASSGRECGGGDERKRRSEKLARHADRREQPAARKRVSDSGDLHLAAAAVVAVVVHSIAPSPPHRCRAELPIARLLTSRNRASSGESGDVSRCAAAVAECAAAAATAAATRLLVGDGGGDDSSPSARGCRRRAMSTPPHSSMSGAFISHFSLP